MLSHPGKDITNFLLIGLILTGLPIRRFNVSSSPCHIGWVSLVTSMTKRNEGV